MSSFLVTQEDVKNFVNTPILYNQEGIYFAYSSSPEVIQSIIPPPLKVTEPIVMGYVAQFSSTTFGGPYMESMLCTPCKFKKDTGSYSYNLMLCGNGAENGVIVGSNCCGIPKKYADIIEVSRIDNLISSKIIRHGVSLLQCDIKLGRYNDAKASNYFKDPAPGSVSSGSSFFHTFNMIQTENGNTVFSDLYLVKLETQSKCLKWEPGELSIKVKSSPDDPFGELAVLKPLGGAYFIREYIEMNRTLKLASLDVNQTMPYLMSGRFDRALMGYQSTYLKSYNYNY